MASPPPELIISFVDQRLAQAVALYNHREFRHARTALEPLLRESNGRTRSLSQGLHDAASAFLHWSEGQRASAMSFHRSSMAALKKCLPACRDVDVADYVQRYGELVQWLRRHRLRYDPGLVPRIRWVRPPRQVT